MAREREHLESSLTDFVQGGWRYLDPAPFVPGWHIEAICDHLQAVTAGEIRRLLINIPPRTSKSTLCSVAWPAWTWAQSEVTPVAGPQVQFLFASYAQSLSLRDSVKTRRLIESPWYQQRWGDRFRLTGDQNTKFRFENTLGGYRLATSVGGSLTGEGGAILLVDDPHNAVEMESEAEREAAVHWWDESLSTRLNDPRNGAYVIIMQRLHEEDLSGHILSRSVGNWTHLCLPMRYEPERHCVTVIGWEDPRAAEGADELLCPERFAVEEVELLEATLGPYGAAGQLQQRPEPRGGGIFKRAWWQPWTTDHALQYGLIDQAAVEAEGDMALKFPEWNYRVASLDTAYGEKEENDWSALTVWQSWTDRLGNPKLMMVYAWRGRLPLHEPSLTEEERAAYGNDQDEIDRARLTGKLRQGLVEQVAYYCKRYKVDRLLIESKANGIDVAREIRRLYQDEKWGITLVDPKGIDKVARAYSVQHMFSAGLVYAPASVEGDFRAWAEMVITEAASFPKAAHDDLTDTLTQALRHLRLIGMAPLAEERAASESAKVKVFPERRSRPIYPV